MIDNTKGFIEYGLAINSNMYISIAWNRYIPNELRLINLYIDNLFIMVFFDTIIDVMYIIPIPIIASKEFFTNGGSIILEIRSTTIDTHAIIRTARLVFLCKIAKYPTANQIK